jgi:hypothetical protein
MSNFNNQVTFKNYQKYFVNKFRDFNLDVDPTVNEEMIEKKKRNAVLTQSGYKGTQYAPEVISKMCAAIDTKESAIDRVIANKILCLKPQVDDGEKVSVSLLNEVELGVEISEKFDCKVNSDPAAFERDCRHEMEKKGG